MGLSTNFASTFSMSARPRWTKSLCSARHCRLMWRNDWPASSSHLGGTPHSRTGPCAGRGRRHGTAARQAVGKTPWSPQQIARQPASRPSRTMMENPCAIKPRKPSINRCSSKVEARPASRADGMLAQRGGALRMPRVAQRRRRKQDLSSLPEIMIQPASGGGLPIAACARTLGKGDSSFWGSRQFRRIGTLVERTTRFHPAGLHLPRMTVMGRENFALKETGPATRRGHGARGRCATPIARLSIATLPEELRRSH